MASRQPRILVVDDDAGVRERAARQLGEHHALLGPVVDDADDLHVELLDLGALEDRAADAPLAGPDLRHREDLCGRTRGDQDEARRAEPGSHHIPIQIGRRAAPARRWL